MKGWDVSQHYRNALHCWGWPLVLGIATALLWWATAWDWLMLAGMLVFYMGIGCCCYGYACLFQYWQEETKQPNASRKRIRMAALGGIILLSSNFVVAFGVMACVAATRSCFVVEVSNASHQMLTDVKASGGGCEIAFGEIVPGGSAKRRFWIQTDGQLLLKGMMANAPFQIVIEGYVTNGIGGSKTVAFREDGTIAVEGEG
jgi:hypothetical protein